MTRLVSGENAKHEGVPPNDFITKRVDKATDTLVDMDDKYARCMSPAHKARKKIIYDQLMILSRYNPKNRNHGQKSLPTWNGEYGTLHTFLLQFDEQIITEQSESQRRIWLDEKCKPYNEQFRHCTTYAAARKFLGDVMTDPETTAAQYERLRVCQRLTPKPRNWRSSRQP